MLHLQMVYLTLMNSFAYLAPSLFLFTVDIAMQAFRADILTKVLGGIVPDSSDNQLYNAFVYTIDFIYVLLIISIVFFSLHLTNGNKKFKPYLYAISTIFGMFSVIVFTVLFVDVIRGLVDSSACKYFLI